MSVTTVESLFKNLKLATAASELNEVLKDTNETISFNWLINLLQRETDSREERSFQRRIRKAKFPEVKSLEAFDWNFNPSINKEKVYDLASLKFIERNGIILFLGQPGTGKSHLAMAIGLLAVNKKMDVYWTSLKRLAEDLRRAKEKNELSNFFRKVLSAKLWILDDWGVVSLARDISEEVFDLLDRRKYSTAMILTSNRDIGEWPQVFSDPVLASAAIDRIFDRANVTIFQGRSYRSGGENKKCVVKN